MIFSIIVSDPGVRGGEPVFRRTRVPFKSLMDYLKHGRPLEEFLDDFPGITRESAIAALEASSPQPSPPTGTGKDDNAKTEEAARLAFAWKLAQS
jgi:uncharacterized protein (DUF433 family)